MTRSGPPLIVAAVAGVVLFGLSFVDGWIVHDRVVTGEGYRDVRIVLSAWRSVAVPVLTIGALAALATAIASAIGIRRPSLVPRWLAAWTAVLSLACIGSSVVPLEWDGYSTFVDLSVGSLTAAGIVLAGVMVAAALIAGGLRPGQLAALALAGVVATVGAVGARWLVLDTAGGSNQAWSEGSYTRAATAEQERETLSLADGRYRIADRWAGTWESGGWTVVLDNDPACPGSRGAYHAHVAGDEGADLRFVKIVDTCEDGARALDLETGIWERDP